MGPLPPIDTEADLLAVLAERGSITNHDIEESEHLGIYAELINNAVEHDLLNCAWSDLGETWDGMAFEYTQTWTLKGADHDATQ